jgi:hypothetical protein
VEDDVMALFPSSSKSHERSLGQAAPTTPSGARPMPSQQGQSGAAMLMTLLVMLVVFALGSAMAVTMLTEITVSANYRSRGAALWQADSGLERVAVDLLADPSWARDMVNFSTLPMVVADPFPLSVDFNGIPMTFTSDGQGSVVGQYYDVGGPIALDDGSFTRQVFMPPLSLSASNGSGTKGWLLIRAGATGNSGVVETATQSVRSDLRVTVRRLTVWDNAIFGGAGQGGNAINGNVQVRGSVHVIGDPGDVIDSNGTAFVINNYRNLLADYGAEGAKLPALPTITYNGESVQTLDAEVRVKWGTINLGGTAQWGTPDVTLNPFKETLDGYYSDATLNITSGSAGVFADEDGGYDAPGMAFPTLDDPYYHVPTSTAYAQHRTYLNAAAMTIPVTEISDDIAAFSFSDGFGNSIDWNPATATMQISGIVKIVGDLDLALKDNAVNYSGTGTVFSTGNIRIHGHVLPTGDYLDTSSMPVHNLGLIADANMELAAGPGESAIKVMGALYAEGLTTIEKQTNVAGAVVAQGFDLGSQVPSVWQVPKLATNLPPGMPGSAPMLFVSGVDVTNWYHAR